MKKTKIISAFPCCGKSYIYDHYNSDDCIILDSDSSQFSWIERKHTDDEVENYKNEIQDLPHINIEQEIEDYKKIVIKERNPEFPSNYIQHIQENIGKVDIIFVSSHLVVRQAMEDAGINFITVYPKKGMLNEWVGRMYRRGNDKKFIQFQIDHWDEFVENDSIIFEPHGCGVQRLGNNEYLSLLMIQYWYLAEN